MLNATTFVELGANTCPIKAVSIDIMTSKVGSTTSGYDHDTVAHWVESLLQPAKCVYKSRVTDFNLQKWLSSLAIDCAIEAVHKMIKPAVDRKLKNDRMTPGCSPQETSWRSRSPTTSVRQRET